MYKKIIISLVFILGVNNELVSAHDYEKIMSKDLRVELSAEIGDKSKQIKRIKQRIDEQLTESEKKLSTDLLQLIDSKFLPEGTNIEVHAKEKESLI